MVGTLGPGVGVGKAARFRYVATAGQTTFSSADASAQALTLNYTPGFVEVALNGVWLTPDEYTATSGSSIVFPNGLAAGDVVYVYALSVMSVANTYDKTQNGADITVPATFRSYLPDPGAIFGLTMSTAGASTTLTVAAGFAADSTNVRLMNLASATAKTTSAWAVGTAVGGLDTSTIANSTWYHWFLIMRVDTGVVDVLFSLSATAPTMPTNYTLKRRIGSMKTNGSGQWTLFIQLGDEFLWSVPVGDVATATLSTTATLFALSVPSGIQVNALYRIQMSNTTGGVDVTINSPDEAVAVANTPSGNMAAITAATASSQSSAGNMNTRTDTSRQIRAVSNAASTSLNVATYGWIDTRGRNA